MLRFEDANPAIFGQELEVVSPSVSPQEADALRPAAAQHMSLEELIHSLREQVAAAHLEAEQDAGSRDRS